MFLRKKSNKSGSTSVQVIQKNNGVYKVLKTIGSSKDLAQVLFLEIEGAKWIKEKQKFLEFDFEKIDDSFEYFIDNISSIKIVGPELLLGKLFDDIGFNLIEDELFRKLVIGRINYPVSKLKLTEYLARYENYFIDEDSIYRYLDTLNTKYKRVIQDISYAHSIKVLDAVPTIVFYDVTTLYFEIEREDELRIRGFSKDGKHQSPQIVLGLLISTGGYPLGFEIYKGNKYEGDTMMPILNLFKRRYKLENIIIVADSGLLSKANIASLEANKYEYIIGARIKAESKLVKDKILSLNLKDNEYKELEQNDTRLIISYSIKRAKKDGHNREIGIKKLEKDLKTGKLKKDHISNRGYKKFLQLDGEILIKLDEDKITEDKKWDGLKGYKTNTKLKTEEVINAYKQLWIIEKAFRINKTDIKIRPIYHRLPNRIEAHICICFAAYKIIKELERQLKEKKIKLSPEKAIEIARSIKKIEVFLPIQRITKEKVLYLTEEHLIIRQLWN